MQGISRTTGPLALLCATVIALLSACDSAPPTVAEVVQQARPTPTTATTVTPTHSPTPTPSPTSVPTATPTASPTPTATPTATPTPTAVSTPSPAATATHTPTPTPTLTPEEAVDGRLTSLLPWFADPAEEEVAKAARWLRDIWLADQGLGETVAQFPWVVDGINIKDKSESAVFVEETYALQEIAVMATADIELARLLTSSTWVADDLTAGEVGLISFIENSKTRNRDFAVFALDIPPLAGEAIEDDQVLNSLVRLARNDQELTRTVLSYADAQEGDLQKYLLSSLARISASEGPLEHLTSQAWFMDGLHAEEAALVAVLADYVEYAKSVPPPGDEALYNRLVKAHFSQLSTISLPLAGEVNIWIFQDTPFPRGEDLLTPVADAARILEEALGVPFPTDHVIFLVTAPSEENTGIAGRKFSSHIELKRGISSYPGNLNHEMGHYYFDAEIQWFTEGGADFMHRHIARTLGEETRSMLVHPSLCDDRIESILHLEYHIDYFGTTCSYRMGDYLLVELSKIMGAQALFSALGELVERSLRYGLRYQQYRDFPPGDELRIYDTFLKHAPAASHGELRALYRELHGDPHVAEHDDDHGDSRSTATLVSVGDSAGGALDYEADFDFFRFEAQEGRRYRIQVDHDGLSPQNVWLHYSYGVDSSGQRELLPSGPQLLWTAPFTGEYYVSVEDYSGKTGSYMLTITLE